VKKTRTSLVLGVSLFSLATVVACSGTDNGGGSGGGSSSSSGTGGNGGGGSNSCVNPGRMDLLLAIDNSRSMADKQQILARTVSDLVQGLVNPPCTDPTGAQPPTQPADPADACPSGLVRAFTPLTDIHIGVISSSLGGHGSDSCAPNDQTSCGSGVTNTTNNDAGHLLSRLDACTAGQATTYLGKGFLAWDPLQKLMPPGESQVNDNMGGGLAPTLRDMVVGVGQIGCGYESQLESIYRFLVDPEPYQSISLVNNIATPTGIDATVLTQRADFLRPDSLLTIAMLSDENDCSTKEYGQFYTSNQLRNGASPFHLPRPRSECATNPNDPCCLSCGQNQGTCPPDPSCSMNNGFLTEVEDNINLRCWDQKRRFGIDFLYPIDRYQQAFMSTMVTNRAGELVPNPIFMDLNPNDPITAVRGPERVLFTGIVGVPWQDIARDKNDASKGFKDADELNASVAGVGTTWDLILGDPGNGVAPKDPLMIESMQKRAGVMNPNPINGNDWTITAQDDLQYACIFPLIPGTERDCTDMSLTACDCIDAQNDNPLCAPDPTNSNQPTLQVKAKGYPGTRTLALMKSLGDQALVGSVCAPQVTDATKLDFGYRPIVRSVVDWLTRRYCPPKP